MFLSTPTEILSLLGYFFDWIFSKPFWLQAIQISNLVLSIYNVVASGPLLKLQAARSQEPQNIYSQDGPGRTFNTTISNTPVFKGTYKRIIIIGTYYYYLQLQQLLNFRNFLTRILPNIKDIVDSRFDFHLGYSK